MIINYFIYLCLTAVIIFISKKKQLLPNYSGEKHQSFVNQKKIPLIGGFILLSPLAFIFFKDNIVFLLTAFIIFFVGFLSDAKILSSAKMRIIYQFIIVFIFVLFLKVEVIPTRIDFVDKIFEIKILSFVFTCFCLLILINGANFIDGLNGLLLGYFLIILFVLHKLSLIYYLGLDLHDIHFLFFVIISLLFLNYLNILFLGDGGSYTIGFILGVFLIFIYNSQNHISPLFVILLLWYPCFENLFSIIRKNKFKNSPIHADNRHLHQLLYFYLSKKLKKSDLVTNNLSSVLINTFNFATFIIGSNYIYSTMSLIIIVVINILIYFLSYNYLFNFRFSKKY
ncbi:MAG: undecaprenyl/decaprenyl-phosphate alpha-N-acetylglucosaminyl 1-phosphate transferase [Rickettsiales bacterium TMED254]|nr:MAG: undecaprenyl/decaprenyl-phosphate alpha-N-acetylglucosaminyl 1-phosphate transferase [Rickettsiales bacterium TMED254]